MLRQFLYLDQDLVRDFLAQAEGGVFDETREVVSTERGKGVEGKAGAGPFAAKAGRTAGTKAESESVVRQTATSEFDRLYDHLEGEGLPVYEAIDVPLTELGVRRKDIIEVDARLRLSGVHALMDLVGQLAGVVPLMQQLGKSDQIDADSVAAIQAMTALGDGSNATSLIGTVVGELELGLALELQHEGVRTTQWDTEATVLLKIQRILREGETLIVGDPFGGLMQVLPDEVRKDFAAQLQSGDLAQMGVGTSEIHAPGIVATPIAIYR